MVLRIHNLQSLQIIGHLHIAPIKFQSLSLLLVLEVTGSMHSNFSRFISTLMPHPMCPFCFTRPEILDGGGWGGIESGRKTLKTHREKEGSGPKVKQTEPERKQRTETDGQG